MCNCAQHYSCTRYFIVSVHTLPLQNTTQVDTDSYRIQPPGLIHTVYTLEDTVTLGGHFLLFDAMHLTEWNRMLTQVTDRVGTNNTHTSIQKNLARIMIDLAFQGPREGMHVMIVNQWSVAYRYHSLEEAVHFPMPHATVSPGLLGCGL